MAFGHRVAAELVTELRRLDHRISTAEADVATAIEATGSTLTELYGIGPVPAGKILARVGPITRFRSAAAFASFTGTAPIEVASGEVVRHRLSRAVDHALNHALHMMAPDPDPGTNRRGGGPTTSANEPTAKATRKPWRCLKRRLPDVIYRRLRADATAAQAGPGGHPRATA